MVSSACQHVKSKDSSGGTILPRRLRNVGEADAEGEGQRRCLEIFFQHEPVACFVTLYTFGNIAQILRAHSVFILIDSDNSVHRMQHFNQNKL